MPRKKGVSPFRSGEKIPAIGNTPVDFSSVYLIGPSSGRPIKIGYAGDVKSRLAGIQVGNWKELQIFHNFWVVDLMIARRLDLASHKLLDKAGRRIMGEWFDVDVEWAKKTVLFAAKSNGIPVYSNAQINALSVTKEELRLRELAHRADLLSRIAEDGVGRLDAA